MACEKFIELSTNKYGSNIIESLIKSRVQGVDEVVGNTLLN